MTVLVYIKCSTEVNYIYYINKYTKNYKYIVDSEMHSHFKNLLKTIISVLAIRIFFPSCPCLYSSSKVIDSWLIMLDHNSSSLRSRTY